MPRYRSLQYSSDVLRLNLYIPKGESRTQGSRPRTQKNPRPRPRTAFPRTDPLEAEERSARGQGQDQGHKRKCSPEKKIFKKFFQAISPQKRSSKKCFRLSPVKNVFCNCFSGNLQNFNNSKKSAVLESRTGQFSRTWGLEAKAKDLTFEAKPRTSKCVFEAKDVLEDSTSVIHSIYCHWHLDSWSN